MDNCYFFDIDGTLLPHGTDLIPGSTVKAIKELNKLDGQVFIASGKNQTEAEKIGNQLGIKNYISSNGQQVFIDGKNIITHMLPKNELEELVEYYHNQEFDIIFQCEREMLIYRSTKTDDRLIHTELSKYNLPFPKDVEEIPTQPVFQIIIIGDMSDFSIPLDNYKNFYLGPNSREILPEKASKGFVIEEIKHVINGKKTYAFGDGPNDIDMFKRVNIAVAMGEGSEKVKANANFITNCSYEDGIYKFLESHKLI